MTYHEIASRTHLVKNPPRQVWAVGPVQRFALILAGVMSVAVAATLLYRSLE